MSVETRMEFHLGPLFVHRREQWDLGRGGDLIPLFCVHWSTRGRSSRVFCLWRWGVLLRVGKWRRVYERRIDGIIRKNNL